MKKYIFLWVILTFLSSQIFAGKKSNAPTKGDFGITASFAGMTLYSEGSIESSFTGFWIGFVYHISDSLALKPAFMINVGKKDHDDNDNTLDYEETYNAFGAALGVFYYLNPANDLSLYMGPEVKMIFDSSKVDGDKKGATQSTSILVRVGAQYMLSKQFGFFADFGLGLKLVKNEDLQDNDTDTYTTFATEKAFVGAVFYF